MKVKIIIMIAIIAIISACAAKKTPKPPDVIAPDNATAIIPAPAPPKEVAVVGPMFPSIAPSAEVLAKGKSLFENNCGKCHKLFSPTDFTMIEWKPIMQSMQHKAGINDADAAMILDYFASQQK